MDGHAGPVTVSASGDDAFMAITMRNWVLTWTDPEGRPRRSAVGYDEASAAARKAQLEAQGCTDVVVEETAPGVLPDVRQT